MIKIIVLKIFLLFLKYFKKALLLRSNPKSNSGINISELNIFSVKEIVLEKPKDKAVKIKEPHKTNFDKAVFSYN